MLQRRSGCCRIGSASCAVGSLPDWVLLRLLPFGKSHAPSSFFFCRYQIGQAATVGMREIWGVEYCLYVVGRGRDTGGRKWKRRNDEHLHHLLFTEGEGGLTTARCTCAHLSASLCPLPNPDKDFSSIFQYAWCGWLTILQIEHQLPQQALQQLPTMNWCNALYGTLAVLPGCWRFRFFSINAPPWARLLVFFYYYPSASHVCFITDA